MKRTRAQYWFVVLAAVGMLAWGGSMRLVQAGNALGLPDPHWDQITYTFGALALFCCAVVIGAQFIGRKKDDD